MHPLIGGISREEPLDLEVAGETLRLEYDSRGQIASQPPATNSSEGFPSGVIDSVGSHAQWALSAQRSVWSEEAGGTRVSAVLNRGAGRRQTFEATGTNVFAYNAYTSGPGEKGTLKSECGFCDWTYFDPASRSIEKYERVSGTPNQLFSLKQSQTIDGKSSTYAYSDTATPPAIAPVPGLLISITDNFGRATNFRYAMIAGRPQLTGIVDPASKTTEIGYDETGKLTRIKRADGQVRQFLYEQTSRPNALTGVIDENTARHLTNSYDEVTGRALSSELAGGVRRYAASYATPPVRVVTDTYEPAKGRILRSVSWKLPTGTSITQPNGTTSALDATAVKGAPLPSRFSQPAGSGCAAATSEIGYDASGNVARRDDFNGNRVCLRHDLSRNIETARIEGLSASTSCESLDAALGTTPASLPAGSRKISTSYHPMWHLPAKVAVPRRLTTHVYNGQPDPFNANATAECAPSTAKLPDGKPIVVLCKTVEQATTDDSGAQGFAAALQAGVPNRVWQYKYNEVGQVLTTTDPLNNVTSYVYYLQTTTGHTRGDLEKVTNALGQETLYRKYDVHGQVLEIEDPNKVLTSYSYDERRHLKSVTVAGVTTSYDYWPTGLLRKVAQPDGNTLNYEYDDAHRLKAIEDGRGNRVEYALDDAGNRKSEKVKDPSGTLVRQASRAYDALNRVQNKTGR